MFPYSDFVDDIKDVCSETATIEERVKARLQQYYEHVERRDYKLKTE